MAKKKSNSKYLCMFTRHDGVHDFSMTVEADTPAEAAEKYLDECSKKYYSLGFMFCVPSIRTEALAQVVVVDSASQEKIVLNDLRDIKRKAIAMLSNKKLLTRANLNSLCDTFRNVGSAYDSSGIRSADVNKEIDVVATLLTTLEKLQQM